MSVCRRSPEGCTKHFYFSVATRQARQEPRTINTTRVWLASVRYIMPLGWDGEAQKSRAHVLHEECLRQFLPSFQGQPRLKSSFTDLLPLPGQDLLGERCFRNSSDCTFRCWASSGPRGHENNISTAAQAKKILSEQTGEMKGEWKVAYSAALSVLCEIWLNAQQFFKKCALENLAWYIWPLFLFVAQPFKLTGGKWGRKVRQERTLGIYTSTVPW